MCALGNASRRALSKGTVWIQSPRWLSRVIRMCGEVWATIDRILVLSRNGEYGQRLLITENFQVIVHHHGHQFVEFDSRFPIENSLRFARIGNQQIDFGGTEKRWIDHDVVAPVQTNVIES